MRKILTGTPFDVPAFSDYLGSFAPQAEPQADGLGSAEPQAEGLGSSVPQALEAAENSATFFSISLITVSSFFISGFPVRNIVAQLLGLCKYALFCNHSYEKVTFAEDSGFCSVA